MIFINHIKINSCCIIDVDCSLRQIVRTFFSMFYVTEHSIGYKSVADFKICLMNNNISLLYLNKQYVFGSIYEALLFISDMIQYIENQHCVGYYHGALCLSNTGKSICLIGETMAGKTSLNMFLYKNGFQYLSDDSIIVNKNFKVISMPTPIKIRHGIIFNDSFFDKYAVFTNNDYKILTSLNTNTTNYEYDMQAFVFLHRGYGLNIIEMSKHDLFLSLISNFSKMNSMQEQILFTKALLNQVRGFNLYYNDLNESLIRIIDAL